jgi:hypothetical protein
MSNNTTGYRNAVLGTFSLTSNTTGYENAALGYAAMSSNTVGRNNTAVGAYSLDANTTGIENVALGNNALGANTTGNYNTAVGHNAVDANTTGEFNTGVGFLSLTTVTTGTQNVAIGAYSGEGITTGSYNTSLGHSAGGTITTGTYNTSVGFNAEPSTATVSGEFTLGDTNVSNLRCNDTTISSLSDGRDKTDVIDSPFGLDFLNKVKVRQYKWATREGNVKDGLTRLGFIAQELLEAADGKNDILDLVYESNPDKLEAKYGNLIPVLAKAVQELSAKVDALEAQLGN